MAYGEPIIEWSHDPNQKVKVVTPIRLWPNIS